MSKNTINSKIMYHQNRVKTMKHMTKTITQGRPTKILQLHKTCTRKSEELRKVAREKVDSVVIGGGIVGIAVARELCVGMKRQVLVIESGSSFGTATSSRDSEVIHAGIYYPQNSLKALLCVRGREMMYKYCEEHDIPHKQVGKLIVATSSSEVPKLTNIMNRGIENGVEGLKIMEGYDAMRIEPELQCVKALLSPVSGIVDSHSLMLSMVGEAEGYGTTFSYNTAVIGAHLEGNQICLHICDSKSLESRDDSSPLQPELILEPKFVVNSAGLSAPSLAKNFKGMKKEAIPKPYFARGCYFTLSSTKNPVFRHLIYPIPEDGGLGVHVTLDLNGRVKFGPDVEWVDGVDDSRSFLDKFDYSVQAERVNRFYPEIRKYYPNLMDESLKPGYAGIRPKLSGPGQGFDDFLIQGDDIHGVGGLVNLFGIESPGLTSSMAIAEHVASKLSRL